MKTAAAGGHAIAVLMLVVASVLWGTTGTAAAHTQNVSPLAIGAASLGIGGLLQGALGFRSLRAVAPSLSRNRGIVIVGALGILVYPLAFYSSMHLGGVALGTVISLGTAPLFAGLLERIVDGARLTGGWYAAAALGITGSALLGYARTAGSSGNAGDIVLGCLLGLAAGASYAVYSWGVGRLMASGIQRKAAVGSVFGVGGVLLLPVLLATGAPLVQNPVNFAIAAYLALIPMFLGYILFGMALSRVPASTATTVTLSEPAVAAALAVFLLGEHLGAMGWSGMVLIGAALACLLLWPRGRGAVPAGERLMAS